MRILIVEDEKRLADALGQIIKEAEYQVDVVYNGNDGLDYALSGIYDAIVLDVMLPGRNGFEIVSEIRNSKISSPIIMLTAKSSTSDKVTGLDAGADDYMTKPFVPAELLARLRALTRRTGEVVLDALSFEDISLNLSTCELSRGSKSVHLNYKEFEILKLLMRNPHTTFSKDDIIVKVWGYESDATDNNVEAYFSFLRKKLLHLESKVTIVSLRKIGYRLGIEELTDA